MSKDIFPDSGWKWYQRQQILGCSNWLYWSQSLHVQIILYAIDNVPRGLGTKRQLTVCAVTARSSRIYCFLLTSTSKSCTQLCSTSLLRNAAMKVKCIWGWPHFTCQSQHSEEQHSQGAIQCHWYASRTYGRLKTTFYHADHFPDVHQIVGQFNGDGLIVTKAKQAIAHADTRPWFQSMPSETVLGGASGKERPKPFTTLKLPRCQKRLPEI